MRIKRFLLTFISVFMFIILFKMDNADAAIYDDPVNFYNTYGNNMQFIDGDIYFAGKGRSASSGTTIRYKTLGYNVKFQCKYGVFTGRIKEGTDYTIYRAVSHDGYEYTVSKITYERLVARAGGARDELLDRTVTTRITLDSINTLIKNGVQQGSIRDDYQYNQPIYDTWEQLQGAAMWDGTWDRGSSTREGMKSIFDIGCRLDATQKPSPPRYDGTNIKDSPYSVGNTYWFKNNVDINYEQTISGINSDIRKVNTALWDIPTGAYAGEGGDISKVGTYISNNGNAYGFNLKSVFCVDGNERHKVTRYTLSANRDVDLKVGADAQNVFDQWMLGLDGNPKSQAIDTGYRIKTDGGAPKYKSPYYENRTSTGMDIIVEGLYDTRSGMREIQFPTWSKDDQTDLVWYTYDFHNSSKTQNNITLVSSDTVDGVIKYKMKYRINYSDWANPNNLMCHVYMKDNVWNSVGDPTLDLKIKTQVQNITVSNSNYISHVGDVTKYWFNNSTLPLISLNSESGVTLTDRTLYLHPTTDKNGSAHATITIDKSNSVSKSLPQPFTVGNVTNVVNATNNNINTKVDTFQIRSDKERGYILKGRVKDSNNIYSSYYTLEHTEIWTDYTAPVVTCNTNTGLIQHGTSVNFTISDSGSGVKNFRYRIIKGTQELNWSNWINGTSFGVPINDGDAEYYIEVQSQDNVLNKASYTGSRRFGPFTVDRQAPVSKITEISGQNYKNGNDYWYKGGSTATIMTTTTDNVTGSSLIELSLDNSTRKGLTASFVDSKYDLVQSQTINSTYVKSFTTEYVFEGTPRKRNITWKPVFTTAEVDYPVTIRARDYANNISGWTGNMLNAVIKIDSTAPTATGWSVTNITPFNFTFKVDGVNDTRSGVKEVAVKITPKSDTSKSKTYKFNQSGNISKQVALTEFSNIYGDYVMDITLTDNVGYVKTYNGYTFNVPRPIPTNDLWEFRNANYIEGNNYWVKPTTKWTIRHRGYFPSSWGVHPTETRTMFTLQSDNSVSTVGARTNYGHTSSNLGNKFSSSDLSGTLTQSVSNGRNIAEGVYGTKAIRDGDRFKMSYTTIFNYNSKEFKEIKDTGKYLCVDGKAPTGNVSGSGDGDTIKVNLTSVSDNGGSGVKSVTAKIVNVDNASQVSTVNLTSSSGNSYNATINNVLSLLPGATTVRVDFTLTDNVGNTRTVSSKNFSMFKLTARLYPKVDPSSTDDCPTMMAGQVGVISSKIWGNANKIEYQFQSLGSLNTSKNLTPQSVVTVDHEFQIPLNTQPGTYNVTVIATRPDGLKKQVNLSFKVQGSITDDLRTHTIYGDK